MSLIGILTFLTILIHYYNILQLRQPLIEDGFLKQITSSIEHLYLVKIGTKFNVSNMIDQFFVAYALLLIGNF